MNRHIRNAVLMLLLLGGVFLATAKRVHAFRIPSRKVMPQLKQLGEALGQGLRAECADFYAAYLEIYDLYAEDITGEFALEKGNVLVFKKLRGKFYGGWISGLVKVTLGEKTSFRIELQFGDADLRSLAMSYYDPGTKFKGRLSGSLKLSGNEDGEVYGSMSIKLKDGILEKIPRWFTMFSLVNINPLRANVISSGRVKMTIKRDRFIIDECIMDSEDVYIFGSGEIDFDGEADIVLNPVGKHKFISIILPPVAVLWKWVEKGIWRVHIKGPLFSLVYRIAPLYKL
ncbi:hypothetical protein ACFL4W_00700 [Planctomycetota bacterium]